MFDRRWYLKVGESDFTAWQSLGTFFVLPVTSVRFMVDKTKNPGDAFKT
jgi:hypothetical protein